MAAMFELAAIQATTATRRGLRGAHTESRHARARRGARR